MDKHIADSLHFSPRNFWVFFLDFDWHCTRRFTHGDELKRNSSYGSIIIQESIQLYIFCEFHNVVGTG